MNRKFFAFIIAGIFPALLIGAPLQADEPTMTTYCNIPPFLSNATTPNILIILDNSGSMNYSAYGEGRDNGALETITAENEYLGNVEEGGAVEVRVSSGNDDAEENANNGSMKLADGDLELGADGVTPQLVGMCFRNVQVPDCGVTITSAYIEFESDDNRNGVTNLTIKGQATDDAAGFSASAYDISNRPTTAAEVAWNNVPAWVTNGRYQTPDLKDIVQEIVDRGGWQLGNDMAFIITGTGRREAEPYNGESVNAPLLHIEWNPDPDDCPAPPPPRQYYGYFNPQWFYTYDTDKFLHKFKKLGYGVAPCAADEWNVEGGDGCLSNADIVAGGLFDGNWMNWMASRRTDIARKVLMGGLVDNATPRSAWGVTGTGNQVVKFDDHSAQTGRWWTRRYDSGGLPAVTPYHGNYYYGMYRGKMYVDDDSDTLSGPLKTYTLAVDKLEDDEPDDFHNGNVAGVLQKVGEQARWGVEFFNNDAGGYIDENVTMGAGIDAIIGAIQAKKASTWTPLAESYWAALSYFMQQDDGMGYGDNIPIGNAYDPFYNQNQVPADPDDDYVYCADSFVILFTDGASTMDRNVPNYLKDFDGDNIDGVTYDSDGSDYLDDVALYGRTEDMRGDLPCDQTLMLYPIYAFGNEDIARKILRDSAINGGFIDKNGDNRPNADRDPAHPDIPSEEELAPLDLKEWDFDADGTPDNYFEAQDGAQLEAELILAIQDILNRASSGTSVSVLATSSEGEGTVVQAYFNPVVLSKEAGSFKTTSWAGYLQSFWVDSRGNLREDTVRDGKLVLYEDRVVKYVANAEDDPCEPGGLFINVYDVSTEVQYPDVDTPCAANDACSTLAVETLKPVWEAGSTLAKTEAANRQIFTNLNKDGINFDFDEFSVANADAITPYLGVKDAVAWEYLGNGLDWERGENLIKYTRGNDTGFAGETRTRNRTIGFTDGGATLVRTWKLGDIVNSTPVSVAAPPDRYGLIYTDGSYEDYEKKYTVRKADGKIVAGRETMVYVGANDGMLHAFTSWIYDRKEQEFVKPDDGNKITTALLDITVPAWETEIGTELWAFIPQAMLPHLKWLADPKYADCHVSYIDLKPKVGDARIFDDDDDHPNGWGTVLIGGMRLGGKEIEVTDDFGSGEETRTFSSSYFAIDITNPREPKLLWEKSFDDMGLTTFNPAIAKVGQLEFSYAADSFVKQEDKWFVILGSGPTADADTLDGFNGLNSGTGKVYLVDVKTGKPYSNPLNGKDWLFQTVDANSVMGGSASFDYGLNYSVDGIYLTESHVTAGGETRGAVYKVTVPWQCEGECVAADYGSKDPGKWPAIIGAYGTNPLGNASFDPWVMHKLFDAPRPLTQAPTLSMDNDNSVPGLGALWVYFGSGRFLVEDDRATTDQEYLFGIKDPFFNEQHKIGGKFDDGYYHNWEDHLTLEDPVASSTIMDVSKFEIVTPSQVYINDISAFPWDTLIRNQREQNNGWKLALTERERSVTKPVVFGGLALFSTFVPNTLICGYDGESYLYALYYQTGTAYTNAAFNNGYSSYLAGKTKVDIKISLGIGMASSPAIHVADQKDDKASAYVQQSTGAVTDILIDPALKVRSGLRSWHDQSVQGPPEPE